MSKNPKPKKQIKQQKDAEKFELQKNRSLFLKDLPQNYISIIFWILIALPLAIGIYFLIHSHGKNGYFGFPLDDPWIHLTFAKNLIEYGSFSYFKNEIVTSGSTSPIYTLLLAVLYFISKNEYVISYILGIGFNVLTAFFIYKIISVHFTSEKLAALLTVLVIAIQPKINLISVSGMETTMFIFFIAGTLYFYKKPNKILLGLFLGLTIWCRPDGFVLWLAIIIDYFFLNYSTSNDDYPTDVKRFNKNDFIIALGIGVLLLIIYFSFNYFLSGSILPNTYKAKLEYYQNNLRENFLRDDVLKYFSSAEFIAIVFPFLAALIFIVLNIVKRRYDHFLVYLLFTIGLIAVYYIQLPFAHRFGRYLLPVIPFYILISVYGIQRISHLLLQKTKSSVLTNLIFILFFGITVILSVIHLRKSTDEFTGLCRYHNERHVAAGLWIKNNTAENSIIAVHDIGAIGYYGNRKLVDMVGLVTPELIQHLNDKNFSLFIKDYLSKNKVTHIAALKNWFEIVNDNPVYVPINKFEILEIYKFNPAQTHIQPREVSYLNEQAIQFAQRNDLANSIRYLQQSLSLDPASSKTNFLIGAVYEAAKDNASAETYFRKALTIFPNYLDANLGLARILNTQGELEEAKKHLQKCAEVNPNYQPARELLERVMQQVKSK